MAPSRSISVSHIPRETLSREQSTRGLRKMPYSRRAERSKDMTMAALKLYDLEPSGNCYKIRLFCSLLGLPLETVPVDFMAGAHKKSPVIDLNPFGELPVLED